MPLAGAAALRFAVTFQRGAQDYGAELLVEGGEPAARAAARSFRAEDCSRLGDAVGLAIALALGAAAPAEPGVVGRSLASEPPSTAPAPPEPPPPSEPRADVAAVEPEPSSAAVLTPVLAAGLFADSGSLPGAGLGLSVGAELRLQRLALRVGGLLFFDRQAQLRLPEQPQAGAELGLALGSASLCTLGFGSTQTALAAFICGGWELGRLEGAGTGVPEPRRGSALWSAPRLDVHLAWAPLPGPVRLALQLGAAAPLQRADFFLRDIGTVHRPPAVVGRAALGLEVGFE
jgi:hypothetical protein